ncbi:alpha-L-fucosidase [Kribbella catacumbae]|nr:alpha-L-fucosidase [Kribbella catacumbae]
MSAKAWFRHDRFGLFVHWGMYSLAACRTCHRAVARPIRLIRRETP